MKKYDLKSLLFLTLCCDMGLFGKRLIAPVANILTDFLRVPGGIGTSFSLMFLVVAAMIVRKRGCATIMGIVQSAIALSLGMVGSMGALSPIGYIIPGLIIDIILAGTVHIDLDERLAMTLANMAGAAAAGLTANVIVFHLSGMILALYISIALASGAIFGALGYTLVQRLRPVLAAEAGGRVKNRCEADGQGRELAA